MRILKTPLELAELRKLKAGQVVWLSGTLVTARDKAHARVVQGRKPPLDLHGLPVYHCGPIVRQRGKRFEVISAGPTTSARMDPAEVEFIRRTGVRAVIGKGGFGESVVRKLPDLGCVYLAFTGGAGVLAANAVREVKGVYWRDLGDAEAVWVFQVEEFGPLVVGVDLSGRNLYKKV